MLHLCIVTIYLIVNTQQTGIVHVLVCLVEDAQHHVQAVLAVEMSVQTGNLYDDAIVCEAVDKRIGKPLRDYVVVVVERLVVDIKHRLLDVANLMAKQIDGHHRQGMVGVMHVLRVGVVHTQILAEAKGLRLKPCLLQLYQDKLLFAIFITDSGTKVYTEYGKRVAVLVAVLMGTDFHRHHIHLQQGRKDGPGYAFILHQVLEHYIIYRIGYYHRSSFFLAAKLGNNFESTKFSAVFRRTSGCKNLS